VKTRRHKEWMKACAIQESWVQQVELQPDSAYAGVREVVVVPATNDVLLGRCKRINAHPGSAQLNRFVAESMEAYRTGSKIAKTTITHRVVARVKAELQGRFLEQDSNSGVWLIARDEVVRLRVSQRFRSRKQEEDLNNEKGVHKHQSASSLDEMESSPANKRVKIDSM
jgi:hypothetical protein